MNYKKTTFILIGIIIAFKLVLGTQESVKAAQKDETISKPLVYQKALDISLGRGGVYFPSSNYTGTAVLTRIKPENTTNLTFTQRWADIHIYDSKGKEFKPVYGLIYVYFNLNADDRAAWNKGKLGIYHYNEVNKAWEECETRLTMSSNPPYGQVRILLTKEFGLYGLAIKR